MLKLKWIFFDSFLHSQSKKATVNRTKFRQFEGYIFFLASVFFFFFLPSLAFFLLAKVPPSFPRKESSFFREEGDLGVGDFGEDGDFCGEEAIVETSFGVDLNPGLLVRLNRPKFTVRGRGNKTWSGSQVGGAGERRKKKRSSVHSLKRKRNSRHFLPGE